MLKKPSTTKIRSLCPVNQHRGLSHRTISTSLPFNASSSSSRELLVPQCQDTHMAGRWGQHTLRCTGTWLSPSVVGFSFFFIIFLSSFPPSNGTKLNPARSPQVRSSQTNRIRMVLGTSLGDDSSGLSPLKPQQGNGETEAAAAATSSVGV